MPDTVPVASKHIPLGTVSIVGEGAEWSRKTGFRGTWLPEHKGLNVMSDARRHVLNPEVMIPLHQTGNDMGGAIAVDHGGGHHPVSSLIVPRMSRLVPLTAMLPSVARPGSLPGLVAPV